MPWIRHNYDADFCGVVGCSFCYHFEEEQPMGASTFADLLKSDVRGLDNDAFAVVALPNHTGKCEQEAEDEIVYAYNDDDGDTDFYDDRD